MPRLIPIRLAAACALALALFVSVTAVASAKKVDAELRVVGKGGKVLAEETLKTGHDQDPDQPQGDLLRQGHRRQRQAGDGQGPDRARPARPGGESPTAR